MDMDNLKCADLQQKLENAKHTLITLNESIRRQLGRNPSLSANKSDKHNPQQSNLKRGNIDIQDQKIGEQSKLKRNNYDGQSVFKRLSGPPYRSFEEESRPRLSSRVIRELPSRQEIVAAQGNDSESRARNRRMFGSLLGTLHKFCQEESRLKQKEDKKAQIEKKLEEQELQERETRRKERELLFTDRKKKKLEIRILELKMSRLKDFECWESSVAHLKHHIRTKTKPSIYFKPRIMCNKTEKLLAETRTYLENKLENKRHTLNRDLNELENSFKDHEQVGEDHCEIIGRNEEVIDLLRISLDVEDSDQKNSVSKLNDTPGESNSKENVARKSNESCLNSSIVAKNESKF